MVSMLLLALLPAADPRAEVARALNAIRLTSGAPAVVGGWTTRSRGTAFDVVGIRARGQRRLAQPSDRFHLGSNGKALTATLAGALVERGALQWTTTLRQAFPEVAGAIRKEYRDVTLEELLNHRSGVSEGAALAEEVAAFRGPPHLGRRRFAPKLLALPPANPRGEYAYSNIGYTLAGAMLERAAGMPFERLMHAVVFEPLGMNSAGFGPPGMTLRPPDEPRGHGADGVAVGIGPESELPLLMAPAGLMHMNMQDWAKFLRLHLGAGGCVLNRATLAKLHRPDPRPADGPNDRYGFGWVHFDTPLGPGLWHNGSNGYWYSAAALIPSKSVAVFAVANDVAAAEALDAGLFELGSLLP